MEFADQIDWKTAAANLKATFPLTASNPMATYNWDIGTIQRGNDYDRRYEVASHRWFDLTDTSGAFGVTVLSDCKNGSDKPDDNTLRLTLLRTPGINPKGNGRDYSDQSSQDWGHHEILYGLASHKGDWRAAGSDWEAFRLNQPLIAFESPKHAGPLGKSFSFLKISNSRVRVMALKKAEQSDEIIVRMVEMSGQEEPNVQVSFAGPLTAAREVNGAEEAVGPAQLRDGELATSFTPYQPRTFAVRLGASRVKLAAPESEPVQLTYDRAVSSDDGAKSDPGFDDAGGALPAEMLPADLAFSDIHFHLGPAGQGKPDAETAKGQTIQLPEGRYNALYVLAASDDGDQNAMFHIGDRPAEFTVENWGGFIGQWDTRIWSTHEEPVPPRPGAPAGRGPRMRTVEEYAGLTPGFIKRADVAWFASHHHTADGANDPYAYSYLFAYRIEVPANAKTLTLPDNDKIRILAVTAARESGEVRPAQPLYDTLKR